jgi:Na+/proline symporter
MNPPLLRFALAFLRLGAVLFGFFVRDDVHRTAVAGAALAAVVALVAVLVVMGPLAAVIGALTVVTVVVVVTVLNVMVTGPHVISVGNVFSRVSCPH